MVQANRAKQSEGKPDSSAMPLPISSEMIPGAGDMKDKAAAGLGGWARVDTTCIDMGAVEVDLHGWRCCLRGLGRPRLHARRQQTGKRRVGSWSSCPSRRSGGEGRAGREAG